MHFLGKTEKSSKKQERHCTIIRSDFLTPYYKKCSVTKCNSVTRYIDIELNGRKYNFPGQ